MITEKDKNLDKISMFLSRTEEIVDDQPLNDSLILIGEITSSVYNHLEKTNLPYEIVQDYHLIITEIMEIVKVILPLKDEAKNNQLCRQHISTIVSKLLSYRELLKN